MSVVSAKGAGLGGVKARALGAAASGPGGVSTGTPFHKVSGESVTGPGVITFMSGAAVVDGVTFTGVPGGGNGEGVPIFASFQTSASIAAGRISGLLMGSEPSAFGVQARTSAPTTYTNSVVAGQNSSSTNTFVVVDVGSSVGLLTGIHCSTSHTAPWGDYPPTLGFSWWLLVNSADTGGADKIIWYGQHNTGSYARYNTDRAHGLHIPFRGQLKLMLNANCSDQQGSATTSATVLGYW